MRKFFTLIALGATVLTAGAQKTVQGARFFDNWSIGVMVGGITPTTHSSFFKDMGLNAGGELTKQITPIFGLGAELRGAAKVTNSANLVDVINVSLLGKFNLSNAFCGYNGAPRLFETEAVVGLGMAHNFMTGGQRDYNYATSKLGLNFNFNLGEKKAWTVAFKPALVYDLNTKHRGGYRNVQYHLGYSSVELMAGVTYHFKNRSNGKHYMTYLRAYDQAEVDGLNAKINDLRAQLGDKEAEIAKQGASIRSLQQALNDCRNQKPVVEVQTQTITKNTNSLEQTVTFRQGKSTVDASQLPNVERVATFLRNHPNATVSIKGYASPEGSAEINAKIALARAEAVRTILVTKYGIASSRIQAEGQGVGNMFSEPDWNRVSICTINEAE